MDDLKRRLIADPSYKEALARKAGMPNILIAPTNYCNFACSYCSTGTIRNKPVNMDMGLLRSIVDQCVEHDWPFYFGQTYEPFLHPNIDEIVRHVVDSGRRFNSATNGCKIKRPLWDLPMDLTLSFSADENDYAYRKSGLPYEKYRGKLLEFMSYRIKNNIPGVIAFQIADYDILENQLTYDKEMKNTGPLYEKSLELARDLGLDPEHDKEEWLDLISRQNRLLLHNVGETQVQVMPIKIQPNSYDAFLEFDKNPEPKGYCDSCHTMMSIQADGQVAFCCCDPSATAVAGTIDAATDIKRFWHGPEMQAVRDAFDEYRPKHSYCTGCLQNVSEHVKPLLTVHDPAAVAEILTGMGVTEDQPWFRFPKS